jgi:hypothetical protein
MADLWKIDLNECRKHCGIDAYIYLMFLRNSSIYFLCVSLVSCVLLPLYKVGYTNEGKLSNSVESMTLLNAMEKTNTMWVVLIGTFTVGIGGHIFVYMFETAVNAK